MLQDYGLIKRPLAAVLRKGKEHYFCKARYNDYFSKITEHKEKHEKVIDLFTASKIDVRAFDLDAWDLPVAIKGKICVKGGCSHCGYKNACRYFRFIKSANDKSVVDFQVTNHNLFLIGIKSSTENDAGQILQRSPYVVIDEAHKLKEAAQSIFGEQFSEGLVQKYINSVKGLRSGKVSEKTYSSLLDKARKTNQQLFAMLRKLVPDGEFDDARAFGITLPKAGISLILRLSKTVTEIENSRKRHRGVYEMDGRRLVKTLNEFVRQNDRNVWLSEEAGNALSLCCCPKNMANVMAETVWNRSASYLLTSGTMSDGADFTFW